MSPAQQSRSRLVIPADEDEVEITTGRKKLRLTNLRKLFWPELNITKRDLLQYYVDISPYLLPHLKDRAMVMKRYPNGATGEFFL
jgi:bifunctional non-homologous end joining protein LigD